MQHNHQQKFTKLLSSQISGRPPVYYENRRISDSQYYEYTSEEVILVLFLDFIYLSTAFHEYGTQREHRQQDKWSLLGLAPFVGEEVKVHNQPNLKVSIVIDTISIVIWKHQVS